jgi:hypothetical protein
MAIQLTQQALDALSNDSDLMKRVADALDVRIQTMPGYISRNVRRLTEASCLLLIAEKTGKEPKELIEENAELIA